MNESRQPETFGGPGFDQLRRYLGGVTVDSPKYLAVKDVAAKYDFGAQITAGAGLANRLFQDFWDYPGSNFSYRTGALFAADRRAKNSANEVTRRIEERKIENPQYRRTINHLTRKIIPAIENKSLLSDALTMRRISRGLFAIANEAVAKSERSLSRKLVKTMVGKK